jgi:hypothetical protein
MLGMRCDKWDPSFPDVGTTWEWVFDPGFIVAQISLSVCDGPDAHELGITAYRERPDPAGAEVVTDNVSGNYVVLPHGSSVTFYANATQAGEGSVSNPTGWEWTEALINIFWW